MVEERRANFEKNNFFALTEKRVVLMNRKNHRIDYNANLIDRISFIIYNFSQRALDFSVYYRKENEKNALFFFFNQTHLSR